LDTFFNDYTYYISYSLRKYIDDEEKCVVLGLQGTGEARLLKSIAADEMEGIESTARLSFRQYLRRN